MEKNSITKLILGFLVLIVGLALIGSIATSTENITEKLSISAESIDISTTRNITDPNNCNFSIKADTALAITNAPTGWKSAGCPIAGFTMYNQSGGTATVTTDYVFFTNNGSLYLKNTTQWMMANCTVTPNTTTVDYTYCGNDYVNIAWGRTILDLISGFFALALLGVSVGIFYSVAKDEGILN